MLVGVQGRINLCWQSVHSFGGPTTLKNHQLVDLISHEHVSKMQLHNDSGVNPFLTLEGTSIPPFLPFCLPSPPFPSPAPISLFPKRFASRLPSPQATKQSASRLGVLWSAQDSPPGPGGARLPNAFRCISVQNFCIWCSYSQLIWQQKIKSSLGSPT